MHLWHPFLCRGRVITNDWKCCKLTLSDKHCRWVIWKSEIVSRFIMCYFCLHRSRFDVPQTPVRILTNVVLPALASPYKFIKIVLLSAMHKMLDLKYRYSDCLLSSATPCSALNNQTINNITTGRLTSGLSKSCIRCLNIILSDSFAMPYSDAFDFWSCFKKTGIWKIIPNSCTYNINLF